MRIALIQQEATQDKQNNLNRGLEAARQAAGDGAEVVGFAELAFEPFYPQRPASGDVKELAETGARSYHRELSGACCRARGRRGAQPLRAGG